METKAIYQATLTCQVLKSKLEGAYSDYLFKSNFKYSDIKKVMKDFFHLSLNFWSVKFLKNCLLFYLVFEDIYCHNDNSSQDFQP